MQSLEVSVTQAVGEKWKLGETRGGGGNFISKRRWFQRSRGRCAYRARFCSHVRCEHAFSCAQWLAQWHCWSKARLVHVEKCSNFARHGDLVGASSEAIRTRVHAARHNQQRSFSNSGSADNIGDVDLRVGEISQLNLSARAIIASLSSHTGLQKTRRLITHQ